MPEFNLPDVGEGLTEAEIVAWHVKVGDVVEVNDPIVDIETAKSVVELPSPYAGEVTALLVEVGETVAVGTPIIAVGEPASAVGEEPRERSEPASAVGEEPRERSEPASRTPHEPIDTNVPPEGNATLVGYGPRETGTARRPRRAPAAVAVAPPAGVLAKPPVRRLAADLGVDLAALTPTGPHGDVTREDVQRAAAPAAPAPTPAGQQAPAAVRAAVPDGVGETREPVKGVRRAMAEAMVASAFSAPHVTIWTTVDVSASTAYLARLRARRDFADLPVSPLLLVARAVTLAVRRTPLLNSWFDADAADGAGEVVLRERVNLGIAAATPRGLVVPNVKAADTLSLPGLARAIGELVATAREGRTAPADQAGGTFTITNVGVLGIEGGTPIINPGESGILCLGAVQRRPWVVTDADGTETLAPRDVVTLTLSFDHRHVDGATGAAFLTDVASVLEDPANALLL
ncbi:2-oxo acid dehydrogenase subunit E2 [Nocardioides sp. ChNu-153]|uniref:dihydrolipoamide acetyltransferase family protein n=1 Tax=unclassified Nocardioides TaxID=2615069 RepID=UPI002406507A|nr:MULTISPECIES: dihydrolipoamide acetyltransferase family protein [unclassified Nocardioides]MDF9715186.1 2-oxo acid dehydrogenase subunit E2 [Nocardioides sp. ChNu-99]MDN7121035.1 2-oxo acid dehydrogenase subunit E2 [Nocardioides sp. ChNu-153]